MSKAGEPVFALELLIFRYKKELDRNSIRQSGLMPRRPYAVRHMMVNTMLLAEALKEDRVVHLRQATIIEFST